jgi:tol-pal system protein YbgF
MPRPRARCAVGLAVVGGIALLASACADRTAPLRREIAELRQKLEAARQERDDAKAKVEDLRNQVMILEDRIAAQAAPVPERPRSQVITLRPAPEKPAPRTEAVVVDPNDPDVEYTGAARDTRSPRPVLRIDGPYARRGTAVETAVVPAESRTVRKGRRPVAHRRVSPVVTGERLPVVPLPDSGVPTRPTVHAGAAAPPARGKAAGPIEVYQRALDALRRKDHAAAIAGFRQVLKEYPHHSLADNAGYWTGEAYYDQKDYKTALAEFRKVVGAYPSGNKAPDALLKAAYCQVKLGDPKSARNLLGQVIELYPKSSAARLAAERLRELSR